MRLLEPLLVPKADERESKRKRDRPDPVGAGDGPSKKRRTGSGGAEDGIADVRASSLPTEMWEHVLRFVPKRQRPLYRFVCTAWAVATRKLPKPPGIWWRIYAAKSFDAAGELRLLFWAMRHGAPTCPGEFGRAAAGRGWVPVMKHMRLVCLRTFEPEKQGRYAVAVPSVSDASGAAPSAGSRERRRPVWSPSVWESWWIAAAGCGRTDALRWLACNRPGFELGYDEDGGFRWAAAGGHIETLRWLWMHGARPTFHTLRSAAEAGRTRALMWLRDAGSDPELRSATSSEWERERLSSCAMPRRRRRDEEVTALWSSLQEDHRMGARLCSAAAAGGHVDTLSWLREEAHCAWNWRVFACALSSDNVDTLRWLRATGCPCPADPGVLQDPLQHDDDLYYYPQSGPYSSFTGLYDFDNDYLLETDGQNPAAFCALAAARGCLATLAWLSADGWPWDEETCAEAAHHGHLECLMWAHQNGCPWNEATCASAARGGHLETLMWARDNGCPWNARTCEEAAGHGRLNCLTWAHRNGCPWDERTTSGATANRYMKCFRWASKHGCPCRPEDLADAASEGNV